jgi:hypothetical protein
MLTVCLHACMHDPFFQEYNLEFKSESEHNFPVLIYTANIWRAVDTNISSTNILHQVACNRLRGVWGHAPPGKF